MKKTNRLCVLVWGAALLALTVPANADPFFFSTGAPNGAVGTASRPGSGGLIEIESADDFILPTATNITAASFYGLLPAGATIDQVVVEIYRVFPKDSNDPPSGNVPTRANSPSDVAFDSRDSSGGGLVYNSSVVADTFAVGNSVVNGIHPQPNQQTNGEGPVTGQEVLISTTFATPFSLPADHYFIVPQVLLSTGNFLWLSGQRPTTPPFSPDLQSWIRNEDLDPDWLRIGTDIIGEGTFNAAFSVTGETVPEPASLALLGGGLGLLGLMRARRGRSVVGT